VRDGVPVMLEGEARKMSEEEKLEKAQAGTQVGNNKA
jgi:hypothetical protein